MKQPMPTYHIKTRRELTRRESLKAHLRKSKCHIRDSLHGGLSRVSNPPYHIKTRRELTRRESLKAHLRKSECYIRDSLHGGPSRVSNPLAGHTILYGKFVMDKHTKVENMQKIYLLAGFPVSKSPNFWNINP